MHVFVCEWRQCNLCGAIKKSESIDVGFLRSAVDWRHANDFSFTAAESCINSAEGHPLQPTDYVSIERVNNRRQQPSAYF